MPWDESSFDELEFTDAETDEVKKAKAWDVERATELDRKHDGG